MATVEFIAELRRYADALPIFIWKQLPDGQIEWANQAWLTYVDMPQFGATLPAAWTEFVHPADAAAAIAALKTATANNEAFEVEHRWKPAAADDGAYRWMVARLTPSFDVQGEIVSWLGTGTDVHDTRVRETERATLLAELGELAEREAESFKTIADSVPQLMWSARPDGWIDWYNRRWYEYTGQTSDEAAGRGWEGVQHPDDVARVVGDWKHALASGKPFESELRLRAADGTFRMFLTRANPLRNRAGQILRWYGTNTDIDVEYNIRIRERHIAQTFQHAALQVQLPSVAGMAFDAIYEPAHSDALVGGDWFDAFRLIDGRVVLSVGDVAGNGLKAAVTMGSLRQSIRTASVINPDPVAILDAVDRIVRDISPTLFATAFIAIFDPVHGELHYASAGHPPPIVRKRDGTIMLLSHSALPLGLRERDFAVSPCMDIEPGMLLVLYTDGLTEFERDPVAGEAGVIAALRALTNTDHPAHDIYAALVKGSGPHDDIAILTAYFADDIERRDGSHGVWSWTFDATDAEAARTTRRAFGDLLKAGGMADDDVISAELVFAELIGNVFRYASRIVRVALDRTGDNPVLHVLDEGTGFEHSPRLPTDLLSEHGRGLYIVSHLAQELSITRRTVGGSHMRAVLSANGRRF